MEALIRELLQEHGVSFKSNSKSFIMTCPRCKKPGKLYIRRQDGRFVCWYCKEIEGFHGRAEFALVELCELPMEEVRRRLYGDKLINAAELFLNVRFGDFIEDEDADEFVDLEPSLALTMYPMDYVPIEHPDAAKGAEYLAKRGIPLEIAKLYEIHYHPAGRRVVFPVQHRGELYGWQGRLVEGDQPYWDEKKKKKITPMKVLTSKDLKRDRVVMFADRLTGSEHAVLTEGPMDALKAHYCRGNIATMGKAVATQQLQLIQNAGIQKVYLGLDPDAWLEIDRIRKSMRGVVFFDLRPPDPYKDLGEMPMEAVKALFDQAPELKPGHIVIYLKNHFGAN